MAPYRTCQASSFQTAGNRSCCSIALPVNLLNPTFLQRSNDVLVLAVGEFIFYNGRRCSSQNRLTLNIAGVPRAERDTGAFCIAHPGIERIIPLLSFPCKSWHKQTGAGRRVAQFIAKPREGLCISNICVLGILLGPSLVNWSPPVLKQPKPQNALHLPFFPLCLISVGNTLSLHPIIGANTAKLG